MIYEVTEGKGETLRIGLQEIGEGIFDITIDDHTVRVDACKTGRTIYSVIQDGKQFEAMVDERGNHGFDVLVAGQLFHLEAVDERSRLLAQQTKITREGPQVVAADMPGKVVKIEKAVGDDVAEGEGIVILEAMKMENVIPAPIDGRVAEIAVSEGETVEAGARLFVIEPPAGNA